MIYEALLITFWAYIGLLTTFVSTQKFQNE